MVQRTRCVPVCNKSPMCSRCDQLRQAGSWSRVALMQEVAVEEPVESSLAEIRRQLCLEVFLDKASQHLYLLLLPLSSRQRIHCRNPWPECPKWDKVRQS